MSSLCILNQSLQVFCNRCNSGYIVVSWRVKIPSAVAYGSEQNRRCWWCHIISILLCKWRLSACYHSVYSLWSWNLCHLVSPRPCRIISHSLVKNWEEINTMREKKWKSPKSRFFFFPFFFSIGFLSIPII